MRLGWKTILVPLAVASSSACQVPDTHLHATHSAPGDASAAADTAYTADTADARPDSLEGRPDAGCQQSDFDLTALRADIMLVVERSGLMSTPTAPTCNGCYTYWTTLVDAIETLVSTSWPNFRWGLKLFPSPGDVDACLVTASPEVPLTTDASAISSALASVGTKGGTPSTMALRQAAGYLASIQDGTPKVVVMGMGGTPTCAMGDPLQDDTDATKAEVGKWGFPVFVVGPGPAQTKLDAIAGAGSTTARFPTVWLPFLQTAIRSTVAMGATNCAFPLPSPAAPGQLINVLLDGMQLSKSTGGFVLSDDGTQVIVLGPYCYNLGAYSRVTVKVGCDG